MSILDLYLMDTLHTAYTRERPDARMYDKNIHVSDLIDFCPRRVAICKKNNLLLHPQKYAGKGMKLTWELGKKIQDIVVNRLNKSGNLVGTWFCLSCHGRYFGFKHKKCPICEEKSYMNYMDTKLILSDYGIDVVGNVDVMLLRTAKEVLVIEVKSIKRDDFEKLTRPIANQARQLQLYLWLLSKKAKIQHKDIISDKRIKKLKIRTDAGVILYVSKQQKNEPYKAYTVRQNDELIQGVEEKLEQVKAFSKNGRMIKPICTAKSNMLAKACHIRDKCFQKRKCS